MRLNALFAVLLGAVLAPVVCRAQAPVSAIEVKLAWNAPASSQDPVAGYNAYRAPGGSSAYVLLNAAPLPLTPTAYVDQNVQAAGTYDYIVESVDAQGVTSVPSNVAIVTVPSLPGAMAKPTVIINP